MTTPGCNTAVRFSRAAIISLAFAGAQSALTEEWP